MENKKHQVVFGRFPARPVQVILQAESDPKVMMQGMEGFFFKQPKEITIGREGAIEIPKQHPFLPDEYFYNQTQVMHFGEARPPIQQLFLAVCSEESMNHKIFQSNVGLKRSEFKKVHGVEPEKRPPNMEVQEEKERLELEAKIKLQEKNKVVIPKYHFHTPASVQKVENCVNKSNTRRVKKEGLTSMINDAKKICNFKLKDIHKINVNIDAVLKIEEQHQHQNDPNEASKNPYLQKNLF